MSNTSLTPASAGEEPEKQTVIHFDLSSSMFDIEQRLAAERNNSAHEHIEKPSSTPPVTAASAPNTPQAIPATTSSKIFESSFLAELSKEAEKKLDENLSATQELMARAQKLNDALARIAAFFTQLIQFANQMEPDISRCYRLDARTSYNQLKWKGAFLDIRKQDLSSTALLAHLTFTVNYQAPEPIVVSRPWNQLDALKAELGNLKLKVLDDTELDSQRPKQEWLQVHLSPDLPVQVRFLANYDKGHIDILSRNLIAFGISSFRLLPEDVSSNVLDDIARVLLGRSDMLPAALRAI
jgi:hypothetical protein